MNTDISNSGSRLALVAIVIAAISLAIAALAIVTRNHATNVGVSSAGDVHRTLDRMKRDGVLHAGVGGFPPYSVLNLNETDMNKRVTGYTADLVKEIAARHEPPLRVEWHQVNWETMKADLDAHRYDFVADPIYQTVPRAANFGMTEPYTYTGVASAVVKADETRFNTFSDLDRDDITISVAVAWTSTEFAKKHLTKPKFKEVSVMGTPFNQLDDVLQGRADVALQDTASVAQYVAAHKGAVKALWLNDPPSLVAAGFLTNHKDVDFTRFLSDSIRILKVDGTLQRLDTKWKTYGYFEKLNLEASAGLRE